jgi:hypothetical protein
MNGLAPIAPKLGKLLRLLSSDKPGEIIAAAFAINRTLQAEKLDIHDLAKVVETGNSGNGAGLSEAERRKVFEKGVEEGPSDAPPTVPASRAGMKLPRLARRVPSLCVTTVSWNL